MPFSAGEKTFAAVGDDAIDLEMDAEIEDELDMYDHDIDHDLHHYHDRRSTQYGTEARDSTMSEQRVVLPHGDPVFRTGWLRVRFKRLGRSVPRFCTLTGACFKHSASPSGEILTDGFDIFAARITATDIVRNAIVIKPKDAPRITIIADSKDELAIWLRDLTRASCRSIDKDYLYTEYLRLAGIGKSLLAVDRASKLKVTVKLTSKRILKPKYVSMARSEAVTLLSLGNHPNILAIRDVYESARNIYLVTEYMNGPTLADVLRERGFIGEADVACILKDIFRALEHIHVAGAVHRMVSPDNIVLMYGEALHNPVVKAKLCNFEFTANVFDLSNFPDIRHMFDADGPLSGIHRSFVAPEVARGDKGSCPQDIWATGVLMHYMLTGYMPFDRNMEKDINSDGDMNGNSFKIVANTHHPIPIGGGPEWKGTTVNARRFCQRLLDPNPNTRYTASQALEDTWIISG